MANPTMTISFDQTARRAIDKLTKAIEKSNHIELAHMRRDVVHLIEERIEGQSEEFYDENTLNKVHHVLMGEGFSDLSANKLVNALLNAGILFRERRPD